MALLQMKNHTLKILAKVKVTFFAGYTFLRNRLSDRAETKCKLLLAKFHEEPTGKILKFHTGRPLSLYKNYARNMKLVLSNCKFDDELNGATLDTVGLSLLYDFLYGISVK